jgi:hypothetical protein
MVVSVDEKRCRESPKAKKKPIVLWRPTRHLPRGSVPLLAFGKYKAQGVAGCVGKLKTVPYGTSGVVTAITPHAGGEWQQHHTSASAHA